MRRLPLAIQTWTGKSKEVTVEQIVNMYVETAPPTSKSPALLLGRPMVSDWLTVGNGPIRGWEKMGGDLYVVSGPEVYKITSARVATLLGTITGTGPVSTARNISQVSIVSDKKQWVAEAESLTATAADSFPGASSVTYLDTYGIYTEPDSDRFFICAQLDFNSFNALDFATAEGDPDGLVSVFSNHRQLWLYGEKTIEVYYNSGNVDFPFERYNDAVIERGLGAKNSLAKEDNTTFFLGDDFLVYRNNQYTPQIISTPAIATMIAGYTDKHKAVGQMMNYESHKFYLLSFAEAVLVYDLTTGLWAEWKTADAVWTGKNIIDIFGETLVGDKSNGKIYRINPDAYDDAGTPVISRVRFPPINMDRDRPRVNVIECELDSGLGPVEGIVMLRTSADGQNWSQPREASIGKVGKTGQRAIWRKCGRMERQMHIEFSISDPVPRRIIGGWVELDR